MKNLEHPNKKLKSLYLNPMRNLKLLEKYQPSPPPPAIKEIENLSRQENEKTSLPLKVSTTLKLPQPYEKASNPLLEKSQFLKKP